MNRLGFAAALVWAWASAQQITGIAAFIGCFCGVYAVVRVSRLEEREVQRAEHRNERADSVLADAGLIDDQLRPPDA